MRILHTAALLSPPAGVLNQMEWEQSAADNLGLQWCTRVFCPGNVIRDSSITVHPFTLATASGRPRWKKIFAWIRLRTEYYRWLTSVESDYDAILLRYYVHDPLQIRFISRCSKPVYLVHHTLEVPELASAGGMGGWLRATFDAFFGRRAIRAAAGIIGVTNEILNYEVSRAGIEHPVTILYPNGVAYSAPAAKDDRDSVLELLFVASEFAPWHGLDLLLADLSRNTEAFILHLIGHVGEEDSAHAACDSRVLMHGMLSHSEIGKVSARCVLGLSSFALYRKKMHQACTLKVREYLMLGLPVYAGYDEVFPEDFKYYKKGEPKFAMILDFARSSAMHSRLDVSAASQPYIDKASLLSRLSGELEHYVVPK